MAQNVSNIAAPVMLDLQGYGNPENQFVDTSDKNTPAQVYKIPPVVWVPVFLVVGYMVIRKVMED